MDDAALGDPMIVGILVKGRGEYSVRENSHAGGEQDGCAELLAISSGALAILRICVENLLIAGRVKGGKQCNGPGNLREGKHHFVHRGEMLRCLIGFNNLRIFMLRWYDSDRYLLGNRSKWQR